MKGGFGCASLNNLRIMLCGDNRRASQTNKTANWLTLAGYLTEYKARSVLAFDSGAKEGSDGVCGTKSNVPVWA